MLDLIPDDVITTHIVPCLDEVATLTARIAELELEREKKVSDDQAHWGQGYGEAVDWVAEQIADVIKGHSASPAEWVRTLTELEDMTFDDRITPPCFSNTIFAPFWTSGDIWAALENNHGVRIIDDWMT